MVRVLSVLSFERSVSPFAGSRYRCCFGQFHVREGSTVIVALGICIAAVGLFWAAIHLNGSKHMLSTLEKALCDEIRQLNVSISSLSTFRVFLRSLAGRHAVAWPTSDC